MPKKKTSVAQKRKRRLLGGFPLSTGKTPKKPPTTVSPFNLNYSNKSANVKTRTKQEITERTFVVPLIKALKKKKEAK